MAVPRKRQSLKLIAKKYKILTSKLNFKNKVCYNCKQPSFSRYCNFCKDKFLNV